MILIIIGCVGIIAGCIVTGCEVVRAKRSSYTDVDAITWCFVGASITYISTVITSFLLNHVCL